MKYNKEYNKNYVQQLKNVLKLKTGTLLND